MALQQAQQDLISEEDYLAGELMSEIKHEYIDGKVFAMAGVSANHKRIVSNLLSAIHRHLLNTPCEVFAADMKVKVQNNFFILIWLSIVKIKGGIRSSWSHL